MLKLIYASSRNNTDNAAMQSVYHDIQALVSSIESLNDVQYNRFKLRVGDLYTSLLDALQDLYPEL